MSIWEWEEQEYEYALLEDMDIRHVKQWVCIVWITGNYRNNQ